MEQPQIDCIDTIHGSSREEKQHQQHQPTQVQQINEVTEQQRTEVPFEQQPNEVPSEHQPPHVVQISVAQVLEYHIEIGQDHGRPTEQNHIEVCHLSEQSKIEDGHQLLSEHREEGSEMEQPRIEIIEYSQVQAGVQEEIVDTTPHAVVQVHEQEILCVPLESSHV